MTNNELFLVTGGTGTLGRLVVPRLVEAGVKVRVLSRHAHPAAHGVEYVVGDLTTGDGLAAAVEGVHTVVHLGGSAKGDDAKARHLVDAAKPAGVSHVVYVSVVGADRVPVKSGMDRAMFGYFEAKLAAERVIAESGLPWTTLRATQFHEAMVAMVRAMAKLPVVPVMAGFRFQPVAAEDVAERLVELALGAPAGLVPDLAGPTSYGLDELARDYLRATHRRRPILSIPMPGNAARAYRDGANLPVAGSETGRRTWEAVLAEQTT